MKEDAAKVENEKRGFFPEMVPGNSDYRRQEDITANAKSLSNLVKVISSCHSSPGGWELSILK